MLRRSLLLLALWYLTNETLGFLSPVGQHRPTSLFRPSLSSFHPRSFLQQTTVDDDRETVTEEALSDVDARVLQSMLQDSKIDLETEADVRKLLERGTVKTTTPPKKPQEEEDASEYASTILKTLADTKLWKKVSAQASDVLESVGIWVANKVEQDVKVLAALGLFAWERAKRDVARALPATSSAIPRNFALTNSSSFANSSREPQPKSSFEEMNRPQDEIQSVTRAILDILQGERVSGAGDRSLRSVATKSDRQRKAYQQRKKQIRQERDVTKVPGAVIDTAWELRRELQSEASRPGYKTEGIRNVIEAGVSNTGNLLKQAQQAARLAAAERKEARRLKQAQEAQEPIAEPVTPTSGVFESIEDKKERLLGELITERSRVAERLQRCIEQPEITWLSPEAIESSDEAVHFQDNSLQDIVTMMIFARDQVKAVPSSDAGESFEDVLEQLESALSTVEELRARTAQAVSFNIADILRSEILGLRDNSDPLILRLEQVEADANTAQEEEIEPEPLEETSVEDEFPSFAQKQVVSDYDEEPSTSIEAPDIVDVIPEAVMRTATVDHGVFDAQAVRDDPLQAELLDMTDDLDASSASLVAEVVTDDDFDVAVGDTRVSASAEDEDDEDQNDNLAVQLSLRSLDIVFFVVEKTFTVGIPRVLESSQTVSLRVQQVGREGQGTKGWRKHRNTISGARRY